MLPFDPALPLLTLRSCAGIGTPCGGPYELSAKGAMARECLEEIYGWFSDLKSVMNIFCYHYVNLEL